MERWWGDILSWSSYSLTLNSSDRYSHSSPAAGEVLTETEQKKLLKQKLQHWTVHNPRFYFFAGLIILD